MRSLPLLLASLAVASSSVGAAGPPARKPLGQAERSAVLALISAVDLAQQTDVLADAGVGWDNHVLKSGDQTAYVPFRLALSGAPAAMTSAVMYVRAVSRRDGLRARDERSTLREALQRGASAPPRIPETVFVGPGEMPVGGPAAGSSRRSTAAPAEATAVLALQQRAMEKQKTADEAAKKKSESKARDPFVFPFEDYYLVDMTPAASDPRFVERALGLPPGEYDVYVAMIDRARLKTSSPTIVKRTVAVPDFWNEELALSSLILAADVRTLKAALPPQQQSEHPYTFGHAAVLPVPAAAFTTRDVLSVVFQICNYGAPDTDLSAEYAFYRVDGPRRLFNRTDPQQFGDADLPPTDPFETQAFATQAVSLQTFPAGQYELEVTVRDRLTRRTAARSVSFTVASTR